MFVVFVSLFPENDLRAQNMKIERFPFMIVIHACTCVFRIRNDVDGMSERLPNGLVAKRLYTFWSCEKEKAIVFFSLDASEYVQPRERTRKKKRQVCEETRRLAINNNDPLSDKSSPSLSLHRNERHTYFYTSSKWKQASIKSLDSCRQLKRQLSKAAVQRNSPSELLSWIYSFILFS